MNFSNIDVFPMGTTVNSQGVLEIGGCDIVSLSKTHGTPLYVYDENTIRNIRKLSKEPTINLTPVSYTHLTLPTNREV